MLKQKVLNFTYCKKNMSKKTDFASNNQNLFYFYISF